MLSMSPGAPWSMEGLGSRVGEGGREDDRRRPWPLREGPVDDEVETRVPTWDGTRQLSMSSRGSEVRVSPRAPTEPPWAGSAGSASSPAGNEGFTIAPKRVVQRVVESKDFVES
jgi:hypothetical protein